MFPAEPPFKPYPENTRKVAGGDKHNMDQAAGAEAAEQAAELKKYAEKAQRMVDSYRRFFETFAQDVSLKFHFGQGFAIDLESGDVFLDARWFFDRNYTQEQILWAVLHELSHFRDLVRDRDGFKDIRQTMYKQAQETGNTILDRIRETCAERPDVIERCSQKIQPPKGSSAPALNPAEHMAVRFHHTFNNIFDDIHVNGLVARKAVRYESDEPGGQAVRSLYAERLFPEDDLAKQPRHLQFLYKLLRDVMTGSEAQVSPEVAETLDRPILFQGQKLTPRQIVDRYIRPLGGEGNKMSQRALILRKTLEPIFLDLLAKDLAEWQPKLPPDQQDGGEGEQSEEGSQDGGGMQMPFKEEYDRFEQESVDQHAPEDIERGAIGMAPKKPGSGNALRPAGKPKQNQAKPESRIDPDAWRSYEAVKQQVAPYLDELSALWRRICFGSAKGLARGMEGHFKTGSELDIPKVVEEYPRIASGQLDEVRVMRRMTSKETLVKKPELIRVRVLADVSGSMITGNKIEVLQQAVTLVLGSLREFNAYLNLTRHQTKSKLRVETQLLSFGDQVIEKKPLAVPADDDAELDVIAKSVASFTPYNLEGSTDDASALSWISKSLTAEDKDRMAKGKIMDIVIVITDGGSSAPHETRSAADDLLSAGVIARCFQIGLVDSWEARSLNQVWNDEREQNLGESIGADISQLIPALTKMLKKHLSNVEL
jgi:hypothetical protein